MSNRVLIRIWVSGVMAIILNTSTLGYEFAGGTGEPNDPYQIATAEQLISIGSDTNLLSKHFVLVNDIDLEPNLPGGRVFDQAVIAPETSNPEIMQTGVFNGVFDGNGHSIKNLTIQGGKRLILGLFGGIGSNAQVRNLGVEQISIIANATYSIAGALAGCNCGLIYRCHSTGTMFSNKQVLYFGGLVGLNCIGGRIDEIDEWTPGPVVTRLPKLNCIGRIDECYSKCTVTNTYLDIGIGGLVGRNFGGEIKRCYAIGVVRGMYAGGLAGMNIGCITDCYASASISGGEKIGGLVARNNGHIRNCFSIGRVSRGRAGKNTGGLVGSNQEGGGDYTPGLITNSFWDTKTSGMATSAGGIGQTIAQMKNIQTYLNACWDFVGETANGTADIWCMPPGGYPHLSWEGVCP